MILTLLEKDVDEQQAIQRLKKGDIGGLEFLVQRHQLKAVRTAYLITRDPGLAEDVVQETFIRIYRAIRSFDEARPFEPWFLRSVVNAAVKMVQQSVKQVEAWNEADDGEWTQLISGDESVESQVEATEFLSHPGPTGNAGAGGEAVTREETVCDDGSACLLITISNSISGRKVWINLQTGQQVKFQSFQRLADGTEQAQFTQSFVLVERASSPH